MPKIDRILKHWHNKYIFYNCCFKDSKIAQKKDSTILEADNNSDEIKYINKKFISLVMYSFDSYICFIDNNYKN